MKNDFSKNEIRKYLSVLNDREEKIIGRRYGFGDGIERTYDEIAREFGLSPARIRQIESKSISKIKKSIQTK